MSVHLPSGFHYLLTAGEDESALYFGFANSTVILMEIKIKASKCIAGS